MNTDGFDFTGAVRDAIYRITSEQLHAAITRNVRWEAEHHVMREFMSQKIAKLEETITTAEQAIRVIRERIVPEIRRTITNKKLADKLINRIMEDGKSS